MHELNRVSAVELQQLIGSRQVSPVEAVSASLERLEEVEGAINAFARRTPELALDAARDAERAVASGRHSALSGIPLSVKDLIDVAGVETSFGSRAMVGNVARADAPSVERIRAAGASILGKTTTTEFGCKAGGGDSPLTGITRNPWDLAKSTGGSSAGAAASVAAGVTPFALGTDGGGSVRIPAALCGLVGVKGQFGRVPVYPPSATPTLGHVGVIARTVRDAALLFGIAAGYDARDAASVPEQGLDYLGSCDRPISGMRVAWSPTLGYARCSPEVLATTEKCVSLLEAEGATVELVDTVFDADPLESWNAEFYAGVGYRLRQFLDETPEILDPAVVQVLKGALYEQTVERYFAQVFRRYEIRELFRAFLEPYDVLVTPTLPVADLPAGANVPPGYEDRNIVSWVYYTYPFNLTGNPALSVPAGTSDAGMPVGLQVVAKSHREPDLFRVAAAVERAQPWPLFPPI